MANGGDLDAETVCELLLHIFTHITCLFSFLLSYLLYISR
jgi:hypothetical protein